MKQLSSHCLNILCHQNWGLCMYVYVIPTHFVQFSFSILCTPHCIVHDRLLMLVWTQCYCLSIKPVQNDWVIGHLTTLYHIWSRGVLICKNPLQERWGISNRLVVDRSGCVTVTKNWTVTLDCGCVLWSWLVSEPPLMPSFINHKCTSRNRHNISVT